MNRGLFKTKKRFFKAPALRPKAVGRNAAGHDYIGGSEFPAQHVAISQDGRRVQNINSTVQIGDEDDSLYTSMILDQEGLFDSPDAIELACEDTSSDRVQVNKPFVVYVSSLLFYSFQNTNHLNPAGDTSEDVDAKKRRISL